MMTLLLLACCLATQDPVLFLEVIYEKASIPCCHCSTIVETKKGLDASWFGGTDEGKVDVAIWVSRHDGKAWSAPVEVTNGVTEAKRYLAWNPVLFQPKSGPLTLFFKIGPFPDR